MILLIRYILIALLLLLPVQSWAAVAFGSVVNVTAGTGTDTGASPSITTPTTNPVVLVHVAVHHATATVDSLTITGFGGTATNIKHRRSNGDAGPALASMWCIVAPTANTSGTVKANFSTTVDYQMTVSTWSGSNQTTPCPTGDIVFYDSTADQTLTASNLTANDGTSVMEVNDQGQNLDTITPTEDYSSNLTNVNLHSGHATGTSSVTIGNNGGQFYVGIAARIVEAAGAATSQNNTMLMRGN